MIEEGVVEGVDRAFAIHVNTTASVRMVECRGGAFLASGDELNITVRGSGGHASASQTARDPITAASRCRSDGSDLAAAALVSIHCVSGQRSSSEGHAEAEAPHQNGLVHIGIELGGKLVVLATDVALDLAEVDVFAWLAA